jgi:hypothetical protein
MTIGDDERRATPREIAEQLWRPYIIEKDPVLLAVYIELGGEINDEVRREIVSALKGEVKRPHASSNPWDDLSFYINVDWVRIGGRSLEKTLADFASDYNLSEGGAKEKYRRGRKVFLSLPETDDPE